MRARRPRGRVAGAVLGLSGAAGFLVALCLVASPSGVFAADCTETEVEIGIVKAKGCFVTATIDGAKVHEVSQPFTMNGFHVEPKGGAKVSFAEASTKRGANVTTNNGFVDLSATGTGGPVHFNNMNFAFGVPKSGELILAESALAQPGPVITGLTPLEAKQPIKLTEDGGATFELSFGLGGLFSQMVSSSDKSVSFTLGFEVADGAYKPDGGDFKIGGFTLANLVEVEEATGSIHPPKSIEVEFDATLKALKKGGLIGGVAVEDGKVTSFTLGVSNLNTQLGTSGVFLQKLAAQVFTAPPFGGSGTIDVTAGPQVAFFGRKVSAMEADGTVEVRSADDAAHKPGYLKVGGNFTVVTLPVGNASFGYYFGQGTEFGASVGIGLPSGKNDPGQPTYLGGRFGGWTTASHFDLDGNATLKVIGVNLAGAKAVLSDYGFAGCLQVVLWVGGGVRWSDGHAEALGGWTCNIGGYERSRSAMRQLDDRATARLALEDDDQVIRIEPDGATQTPQVTLEHSDGRTITSPDVDDEDGIERGEDGAAISDDNGVTTFIPADDPSGDWRLTLEPGSVGVGTVATASELPDHNVRARITGKGRKRTLRWRARDIRHQKLQFSEVLPDGREVLIHETRKHRGEYTFRPVEGVGTWNRQRKLAVDVMQRLNTPRDELVADRYSVRRQPAPSKVQRLRAHRRLDDVVVGWKGVRRAASYEVIAKPLGLGGHYYREVVSGERKRARLRSVGTTGRLRITVTPLSGQGRRGRSAQRTLDTSKLVSGIGRAAKRLARGARWAGARRIVAQPVCPANGHCEGSLSVRRDGKAIARKRFSLPADMTDRIALSLARADRRSAGPVRVVAKVGKHVGAGRAKSSRGLR